MFLPGPGTYNLNIMARVTYGPLVTELSGKLGGVTFQRNASGPIARLTPNPVVNPSPRQAPYENNFAILVAYWPTLSDSAKNSWRTFAALHDHTTPWGEIKTLNGFQWFMSVNLIRLLMDNAIITSAPTWFSMPPPQQFTLQASATFLRLYWSPAYDPAYHLLIYLTLPLRQSSDKLRRSHFYVMERNPGPPITTLDLTSRFESLANVTWADFYASADASIICRVKQVYENRGLASSYTSDIVKVD